MKIKSSIVAFVLCAAINVTAQAIGMPAMGMPGFIQPARYYDAGTGRFISADTVVQDSYDPQSRNRYAYVRNNPLNLVDPSGHSWLSKNISKIVPFVNPYIRPDWTIQSYKDNKEAYIAGGIGFVSSGGNPVVAAAAFATEMGMQTGEGRQVTNHVAKEVFVDAFGMNPKTAYIFSNVTLRMASMAAMEGAWARFGPNQLHAKQLPSMPENIEGGSAAPDAPFGPSAANGGGEGERYFALLDGNNNRVGTAMDRPLQDIFPRTSSRLHIDHTGANMIGYNGGTVPSRLYGTWGVCHTSTNRTLFQAGYSSTVSSLGIGHWSTGFTSAIYGNYGGGLYRAAYWGYDAGN